MARWAGGTGQTARPGMPANGSGVIAAGHDTARGASESVKPARVSVSRWAYLLLAWVFVGCVIAQVFFAGMGVFVDSARWSWHTSFIHAFEWLPLVMLPLAFAARLPVSIRGLTGLLFGLIALQYVTAYAGGTLAALHPVNGLVISWVALALARGAWRAMREAAPRA